MSWRYDIVRELNGLYYIRLTKNEPLESRENAVVLAEFYQYFLNQRIKEDTNESDAGTSDKD